jgi:polysaccharide chain length determinant protein (PEP-CTERM system associated)
MSAAQVELASLEQQIAAANGSLNGMRAQLAATPPTIAGVGENSSTATGQLATLQGQLNNYLAQGWTESHPDVVALRQQIARLRPFAAAEARSGNTGGMSNPSYVSLRAMMSERESALAAATARRNQLQSDLGQLSSRQSTEPGLAAEQARLTRDYDVLKQQYDQLLANREQVRLRSDVQTRTSPINVQVVEPPSVPTVPASPNRPIFLTAVLILGLAAGVAAAFVAGQLQTTFPTQNRLADVTGLPVLGTVSEVVMPPERRRRHQRLVWLGGAGAALAACWAVLILVEFWQRSTVA